MDYELEIFYHVPKSEKEYETNTECTTRISKIVTDGDYSIKRIKEEFVLMFDEIEKEAKVYKCGYSYTPPTVILNGILYDFDRIKYWIDMEGEKFVNGKFVKVDLPSDIRDFVKEFADHRIKLWEKDF